MLELRSSWAKLAVVLGGGALIACGAAPLAQRAAGERAAPPRVEVAWAGEASVTDVLGVAAEGPPRAVMVPLRPVTSAGERALAPRFPGLVIHTECGQGYCVDGLSGQAGTLVAEDLSADERETLAAGDGSWVERGLRVAHADDQVVSVQRAEAWFADGAAHSHAALRCETHARTSSTPASLAEVLGPAAARAVHRAVTRFVATARAEAEPRADRLEAPGDTDFLLDGRGGVIFCATSSFEADVAQLIRATFSYPAS